MIKYMICLAFVLSGINNPSFSQGTHPDIDKLAGEPGSITQTSLYLSTSKDIYVSGEDLWFNAFILNATDFTLSSLDNTLYLQLQEQDTDSIVWQEMYPISNGLSAGHVYLPPTLTRGTYLLKGYTAHSFFTGQPWFYAAARIQVVNDPQEIRTWKKQQQPGTLAKEGIQFHVFPEGGNLVADALNRVAFKAVDKDGQPVAVKGTLLKGNTPLLDFNTVHDGMGSFLFTPEKNTAYHIRLAARKDSVYPLPIASGSSTGMRLVKKEGDSLTFRIITPHTTVPQKFYLRLQVRGAVQSIAAGRLNDSVNVKIPVQNSPQGIGEVTLFNEQLQPIAERLVYLHPEQQFSIRFSMLKEQYNRKEKVSVKINTTDANGSPVAAVLSLRVYDDLFHHTQNTDIVSYYYLSTQIRGRINDPGYYFDSTHANRHEAMDLLLLTQGWRRYVWDSIKPVLSDSLPARITAKKAGKEKQPPSLFLFNYNKTNTRITLPDNAGRFYLTPEYLALGPRFFVKYFSDKEYIIHVDDPFEAIRKAQATHPPTLLLPEKSVVKAVTDTAYIPYGKTLKEITVAAKGPAFSDRYFGYLDSIAKYEGNTDYVGACGWLNCPDGRTDIKPVEGKTYHMFSSSVTSHQHVILTADNNKEVVYHYPKYTEQELLKKFKMTITKGYYQSREFYEPDYDKETSTVSDTRNTLLWKPTIVTDKNGEATVEFFSSDVTRPFIGIAEGVTGAGVLGVNKFSFRIR
ncbi:hypothetical protein [Chitinophaga arvensicola]|uniref:MG2 domain-containing protein n=1 Tax=Chitinophaga arvensicola TaxID=29529 RepID=A0A1I0S7G6_9BACT|nr:hypothetical protein [Chitinophaga arvensicola]SEW51558.1 hypothetical protein SAMN04488122_4314 [Chitinophaga arvensicola]